jgi:hypothetical protein
LRNNVLHEFVTVEWSRRQVHGQVQERHFGCLL